MTDAGRVQPLRCREAPRRRRDRDPQPAPQTRAGAGAAVRHPRVHQGEAAAPGGRPLPTRRASRRHQRRAQARLRQRRLPPPPPNRSTCSPRNCLSSTRGRPRVRMAPLHGRGPRHRQSLLIDLLRQRRRDAHRGRHRRRALPPPVLQPAAPAARPVWPALRFVTTAADFAVQDLPDCPNAERELTLVTRLVTEEVLPPRPAPDRRPSPRLDPCLDAQSAAPLTCKTRVATTACDAWRPLRPRVDACYAKGSDGGPLAQLQQQTLNRFPPRRQTQTTPVFLAHPSPEQLPPGQKTAGSTRNGWQYGAPD